MVIDEFFFNVLCNVSFYSAFIPLIAAIINYKYIQKSLTSIFILLIIAIVVEVVGKLLREKGENNFFLFHGFTIIEFTLLSLFYYNFFKKYFNSLFIIVLIFGFVGVAFVDYKINGLNDMDSFSGSTECLILTIYSLYLFYFVLQKLVFSNLLSQPVFWINSAVLLYFAGNLLLFIFSNDLLKTDLTKHYLLWAVIHSFCNIFYNLFLTVGFWKAKIQ